MQGEIKTGKIKRNLRGSVPSYTVQVESGACISNRRRWSTIRSDWGQTICMGHGKNVHMYAGLWAPWEHWADLVPHSDLCPHLPLCPLFLIPPPSLPLSSHHFHFLSPHFSLSQTICFFFYYFQLVSPLSHPVWLNPHLSHHALSFLFYIPLPLSHFSLFLFTHL